MAKSNDQGIRSRRDLGLQDIAVLRTLEETRSVQATAEKYAKPRAQIYRIIGRANEYIRKPELSWREKGVFRIPPEIRRLINVITSDATRAVKFPHIITGQTIAVMANRFLIGIKCDSAVLEVERSANALERLLNADVDLVLKHKIAGEEGEFIEGHNKYLAEIVLLEWDAVKVRPGRSHRKNGKAYIEWSEGSFAARLKSACLSGIENKDGIIVRPSSYLGALELLKQGVDAELILPRLLLGDISLLPLVINSLPVNGTTVAICRREDIKQLGAWVNAHEWRKIFD